MISGTNRTNCDPDAPVFNPDPNTQVALGASPSPNVDFLDPSLRQPAIWKANLAFESELPWGGLVAGAEWLYTKVKSGIYYKHLNLGPATAIGPDGRELYYNANGRDSDCWGPGNTTTPTGPGCGGAVSFARAVQLRVRAGRCSPPAPTRVAATPSRCRSPHPCATA